MTTLTQEFSNVTNIKEKPGCDAVCCSDHHSRIQSRKAIRSEVSLLRSFCGDQFSFLRHLFYWQLTVLLEELAMSTHKHALILSWQFVQEISSLLSLCHHLYAVDDGCAEPSACLSIPSPSLCSTPTHYMRMRRRNRIQDNASAAVMSDDSYEADDGAYRLNSRPPVYPPKLWHLSFTVCISGTSLFLLFYHILYFAENKLHVVWNLLMDVLFYILYYYYYYEKTEFVHFQMLDLHLLRCCFMVDRNKSAQLQ